MSLFDVTDSLCLDNLKTLLAKAKDTIGRYRPRLAEAHQKRSILQDNYRIYGHSAQRLQELNIASRVAERLQLLIKEGETKIAILEFSIKEAESLKELTS